MLIYAKKLLSNRIITIISCAIGIIAIPCLPMQTAALEESAPSKSVAPTELNTEPEAGAANLDAVSYVYRVLVKCDDATLLEGYDLISSHGDAHLIGFSTLEKAQAAANDLSCACKFAVVDRDLAIAGEQTSMKTYATSVDEVAVNAITKEDNPLEALDAQDPATLPSARNTVALIDTGAPSSRNLVGSATVIGGDVGDANGHATMMADAMKCVDEDVSIYAIKALDEYGCGTTSSVYAAMQLAIKEDVSVINLSLSAFLAPQDGAIASAVADAKAAGIVVVGAAGNDGIDADVVTPGGIEDAWIVGACDMQGARIDSSNYGDTVDVYAVASSTSIAAAETSAWIAQNADFDTYETSVRDHLGCGLFFDGGPLPSNAVAQLEPDDVIDAQLGLFKTAVSAASTKKSGYFYVNVNGTKVKISVSLSQGMYSNSGSSTNKVTFSSSNTSVVTVKAYKTYAMGSSNTSSSSSKNIICPELTIVSVPAYTYISESTTDNDSSVGGAFFTGIWNNQGVNMAEEGLTAADKGVRTAAHPVKASMYIHVSQAGWLMTTQINAGITSETHETLNLAYKIPQLNVSFDANGGTGSTGPQTFSYNTPGVLSANSFSRSGYSFAGWNSNANGSGTLYAAGVSYAPQDIQPVSEGTSQATYSKTLYAQWTPNKYYIDLNGTLDASASENVTNYATVDVYVPNTTKVASGVTDYYTAWDYGTTYKMVATATKGHHFTDGTTTQTKSGTLGAGSADVRFALATNTYTLAYDGNGATGGTTPSQQFTYGSAKALSECGFARNGHVFAGWNTKPDGSGTAYAPGQSVSNLTDANGATVKLYAQWVERELHGSVVVSGNVQVGSTLMARLEGAQDGVSQAWQWQASDDGETWTDLDGATGPALALSKGNYKRFVRACAYDANGIFTGILVSDAYLVGAQISATVPAELDFTSNADGSLNVPTGAKIENQSRVPVCISSIACTGAQDVAIVNAHGGPLPADSIYMQLRAGDETLVLAECLNSKDLDSGAWKLDELGGYLQLVFSGSVGRFEKLNPDVRTQFASITWTIEGSKG